VAAGQHKSDSNDYAQDKADYETEAGGVPDGTLAQVKNAGRFILVHTLNLHRWPRRTTEADALCFSADCVP
jgi:hypothetical protein